MDNEVDDAEWIAKRQRRSHHKNQLPAFCHCARCGGNITQNQRTIDDHRKRYPREPIGQEPTLDNNLPGSAEGQPPGEIQHPAGPLHSAPPLTRPDSPDGETELGNAYGGVVRSSEASRAASPAMSSGPHTVELDEAGGFLGVANQDNCEYSFDRLLDGPLDEHGRYHQHPSLAKDHVVIDDGGDPNNMLYDEDFGLPDAGDDPRVAVPDRFHFVPDDEPEHEPDGNPDDVDDPGAVCAAFQEHYLIRNAYIDALIQKNLYGATHRAIKHQLKAARRTISAHPDISPEDIANMAQTIGTVERRLGVSTDNTSTTFTLCPTCKRRYTPKYIAETDNMMCLNQACDGVLFTIRDLANKRHRRISNLTYPFASPIAWLRLMLMLAGISELLQTWRTPQDDNGLSEPIPCEEWMRTLKPDQVIGDISEGWGWRSTYAGLERHVNPGTGDVADESSLDPPIRFVSLPFGLSLSLNTDWFQATKEGNYSVGACYLVINNLPRHMRFLRENISLCIVMPGPNEPDDYALNQILEPLVDELLTLEQGVRMIIRKGDPPVYEEELVHGELTQHIADLIARTKIGGGAGIKSELNFCLYCHSRLSSLSVPAGFRRNDFEFRDPQQELNNVHQWKMLQSLEEQKALFSTTGNRFTALHQIPGWYTATSSPIDAMHLLYLGAMNWIVKQVLVGPGMLNRRRPGDPEPQDIFNACIDTMWMPKNLQRLPPKLGRTRVSIKADQWKLTSKILFIPLFLAFRDGDSISSGHVPRGNQSSSGAKHQAQRAKLLHQQRQKYFESIGNPDECPTIEECYPSRSLRFHYRQVLRFCLAINTIDKRTVTPTEIGFAQRLLESLCMDYVNNNIQLPPNFHYMMHLEESILKTGSVYNTHVWGMERANGIVSQINHNGKTNGILEGTLMQGWWSLTTIQNLIENLRSLPNRSAVDDSVIEDLLTAIRGGAEHAQQRGTLMAFIAQCQTAYTRLHGLQSSTRLSNQFRVIDLEQYGYYALILQFCKDIWPNAGIFGPGFVRDCYLAPVGMVYNHSYVEHDGVRYGSYEHTSGKGYCYAYIDGRKAVRIERILHVKIPGDLDLDCICALVCLFQEPQVEPHFPWDNWSRHLGVSSWAYGELGDPIAIPIQRFSGTFALFDVPMSYSRYWVTVALDNISLQREDGDEE